MKAAALGLIVLAGLQAQSGRISRAGVARAQAVVDSVFLDRKATEGTIEGGDWASYLMARLGVAPLPENTEIVIAVDTQRITLSGRIRDLPAEARAMIGPLAALVDSSTVLAAEIALLPSSPGLSHFRLEGVRIGGFPVPELILRSMLLDVGEHYPALTKTGRDLFVEIPQEGKLSLISGAVRLTMPPGPRGPAP